MIGRLLIPRGAHLAADAAPARRPFSLLDERQLIPGNMQRGPLETQTNIPLSLPLAVLVTRLVVPRDTPATALSSASVIPDYQSLTILDERIIVPAATSLPAFATKGLVPMQDLPDVLPHDIITTGEVNLMVEDVEHPRISWSWIARTGSLAAHFALLFLIVLQAKLSPPPPQPQADIARDQISYLYMPPLNRAPVPAPAPPPRVRVDPRYLRQLDTIDQNALQPILGPRGPKPPTPEANASESAALTPAPPAPNPAATPASAPAPVPAAAPKPQPAPKPELTSPGNLVAQGPGRGLLLPRSMSPGRALEESAQEALRGSGAPSQGFGEQLPGAQGGGGRGGNGQGFIGSDMELLTPTEGVDFTSYLARVLASVKRNWFSVIPESVRLGEQGRVLLQFRILKDGLVPDPEPTLTGTSGKEPLDRAAMSSIKASSPFPPLPPAFSGPYIELRIMFLYNMPPNYR